MNYSIEAIAYIRSPFKEKFATPRQPGLTPTVEASVEFLPQFAPAEALRGLEQFSHIWLMFLFHQNWQQSWTPTVRPPRLGGNRRIGVYATRSPYRPNPIGLSAVKLLGIEQRGATASLLVEGADLIDGTPIVDIKPYIAYSDAIADATSGFAEEPPSRLRVNFSNEAQKTLNTLDDPQRTEQQICEVLSLDPRPAYRKNSADLKEYGVLLDRFNIRWRVDGEGVQIVAIETITSERD
jgi:tRNA-Thr(GGU) m(6)t(6)A37 methyltransferase TsaA